MATKQTLKPLVLDQLDPASVGKFEKESRIGFLAPATKQTDPQFQHVVLSGSVDHTLSALEADPSTDKNDVFSDVHLVVGPWWANLQNVVAHVTIGEFYGLNPDEDDQVMWGIQKLKFTKQSGLIGSPNATEMRIRLQFRVHLQGQHYRVFRLNYYATAVGRQLGQNGIDSP